MVKKKRKKRNNTNATKNLEIPTQIGSTGTSSHPIRDYYVKSSFNSCAGGNWTKRLGGFETFRTCY